MGDEGKKVSIPANGCQLMSLLEIFAGTYFSAIVNGGGTGRITGVVESSSEAARVVERRGNDVERRNCSECERLGASFSLTS